MNIVRWRRDMLAAAANWLVTNFALATGAAILLLVAGELGWGLWNWHRSQAGSLGPAALHLTIFLLFFWGWLAVIAERFCRLAAWMHGKNRFLGISVRVLLALCGCAVWSIIVLGILTRWNIGVFLNLSLLRFAAANLQESWRVYATSAERWRFVAVAVSLLASIVCMFLLIYFAAANVNVLERPRRRRFAVVALLAISAAFTTSSTVLNKGAHKTQAARILGQISFQLDPLVTFGLSCVDFQSLYEQKLLDENSLVSRAGNGDILPTAMKAKPNIICFQVESMRGDVIGQTCRGIEITPNINQLARKGVWFTHAYAPSTHTSLSEPSVWSSLYPLRKELFQQYAADDPWPKVLIWDILKPQGYATAWFSSASESWCGMDKFLATPGLDQIVDWSSGKLHEAKAHPEMLVVEGMPFTTNDIDGITAGLAARWLNSQLHARKPFFATVSLTGSHLPYRSRVESTNVFNPSVGASESAKLFNPAGANKEISFISYPKESAEEVRELYFQALHGIDLLIGQIVSFMRQHDPDHPTIFVVYGDHGECFYEHGQVSHGKLPFEPMSRSALVINGEGFFPRQVEDYPTSLIDLPPTLLGALGLPGSPNFQGVDVLSPNRPPARNRCVYMHVDGLANADGMVAGGKWKYFEDNASATRYLFDLEHDPHETLNLADSQLWITDLMHQQLSGWRTAQLTYYRSPQYYSRFFPPPPAMLQAAESLPAVARRQ